MFRHTLKILQQKLQYFYSVSDHFGTSCIQELKFVKPLTPNVLHHKESSQLICNANQLTGFYMTENFGRYWVKCYPKHSLLLLLEQLLHISSRDVFKALSNTYFGTFFSKIVKGFYQKNRIYWRNISSIIEVWQSPKCASNFVLFTVVSNNFFYCRCVSFW